MKNHLQKRHLVQFFSFPLICLLVLLSMCCFFPISAAASEGTADNDRPRPVVASYKDNPSATGILRDNVSFEYTHSMLTDHCGENRLLPDLAKASVCIATAAYNNGGTGITELMSLMGYSSQYTSHWYTDKMPFDDCHHVAFEIGRADYNGKTIYLIAIRGTSDRKEWYSDFEFGMDVDHYGFKQAALDILDVIGGIVDSDGVSAGNTIIWTTGHSRGAGVSDMVAGFMSLYSDYSHGIPQANIFSYNFACPSVTRRDVGPLQNIYDFNNPFDAIPKVPFTDEGWDYRRFGETIILPTSGGDFYNMQEQFSSVSGSTYEYANTGSFTAAIYGLIPTREDASTPEMKLVMRIVCNLLFVKETQDYNYIFQEYFKDQFGMSFLTDAEWIELGDLIDSYKYIQAYNYLIDHAIIPGITYDQISKVLSLFHLVRDAGLSWWDMRIDMAQQTADASLLDDIINAEIATQAMEDGSSEWNTWLSENTQLINSIRNRLYITITTKMDLVNAEKALCDQYSDLRAAIWQICSAACQASGHDLLTSIAYSHTMLTYHLWINSMYYGYRGWYNASTAFEADWSKAGSTIGEECFSRKSGMPSVTLPEQIISVGKNAFAYNDVSDLSIVSPDTVLGEGAFRSCTKLASVTIPADLKYETTGTDPGSFYECTGMKTLHFTKGKTGVMPDFQAAESTQTLYYVNNVSYYSSSGLTSVILDDGITHIGDYAVYNRTSALDSSFRRSALTNVQFPDSVESIGRNAFYYQQAIGAIHIPSCIKSIGDSAFYFCKNMTASNEGFPECLEEIGAGAFSQAANFMVSGETMKLDENVRTVGNNAFAYSGVTGLEIVNPDTVLEEGAFRSCTKLASVTIPADLNYATTGTGSFYESTGMKTLHFTKGKTGVMPDFQAEDGGQALYYVNNVSYYSSYGLTSVILDDGITHIGDYAVYNRTSALDSSFRRSTLTNVQLPDSVESIGRNAFYYQQAIGAIQIPSCMKSIGDSAFYFCINLSVDTDHPAEMLEEIGASAFSGCNKLSKIYIPEKTEMIGSNAFGNLRNTLTIYGRTDSEAQNYANTGGFTFYPVYEPLISASNTLLDRGGTRQLSVSMYTRQCTRITSALWSITDNQSESTGIDENGLLTVGEDETASRLTVTAVLKDADDKDYSVQKKFTVKKDLTVVIFEPNGGRIDTEYMDVLWNMPFGSLPEAYGKEGCVFDGWYTEKEYGSRITEETINGDAYEITLYAHWLFWIEAGIADFRLPAGLTRIEDNAFEGSTATVVFVPEGCTSICSEAFKDSNLKQIRIPNGCSISEDAFAGCENLLIFGTDGSEAQEYCNTHDNATFMMECRSGDGLEGDICKGEPD